MIVNILPHRPPFLFVDEIKAFNGKDRIETALHLVAEMPFFSGHFPGRPIMPGVLVTEALAQTAGVLLGLRKADEAAAGRRQAYFLARAEMKYLMPALPGDMLRLHARLVKDLGRMSLFEVSAETDAGVVAKGSLSLAGQEQL